MYLFFIFCKYFIYIYIKSLQLFKPRLSNTLSNSGILFKTKRYLEMVRAYTLLESMQPNKTTMLQTNPKITDCHGRG